VMAIGTAMQDAAKEKNTDFWFVSLWNF
jgi:hypothetical protein